MPLCSVCGGYAEYRDLEKSRWLCTRCLASITENKFLRTLRSAKPQRNERFLSVCRGDLQSYYALKTLLKVEREYEAAIRVLELAPQPACEELCIEEGLEYRFVKAGYTTYTELRLAVLENLYGVQSSLLVMPDTLDDLAVYVVSEVLLGDLRGLLLDMTYRVAYPLSRISSKALALLEPQLAARLPTAYLAASARELVEELSRSTPSLPYSAARALLELAAKLRRKL